MATASSASSPSSGPSKSSAPSASSATSAPSEKKVSSLLGSACQVPTALTAQSDAVAYNTGTDGPKPETTRLRSRKRYRALALPEYPGAKKDPQLLKALSDAAPKLWGCDVQTTGVNGLSKDAYRERRKLRHTLRARGGLFNIVGEKEPNAKEKRLALAERPNPPAATPVITRPGGWPPIALYDIFPASSGSGVWHENGASVPAARTTLSTGKAPDTVLHPSDPSLEESPRPASYPRGDSQSSAEVLDYIVEKTQSGLSQSPQDDTSLAIGPCVPEDISASSAPASPPAFGVFAAVELLKSGDGGLFGAAASSAPEAGDPLDLASAVPVPEEAPGVVDSFAEGPVTESELTHEELQRSINDLSMNIFLDTHVADLQAQTGQQLAEQQPQQTEQLQEDIWALQPAEHGQRQQAPQDLSAQLPKQAWDFQPLSLTGQQGQGQGQQVPFYPATIPPQQPAHGPSYAMPQQSPPWFSPFLTSAENALNAPFPPLRPTANFSTWTNPDYPWDIHIYFIMDGQGFWHSVWSGECRLAAPLPAFQPPQPPFQPPRGPRGGQLRLTGRARASASTPVNFGSAPVLLSPAVANAQGNGLLAAGLRGPTPVMMQEQPSEQSLVDSTLLATRNRPGEQVFQPMMSGALQGSPNMGWE